MPFDENKARRAINFFQRCLVLDKGYAAGKPFRLLEWQREIVTEVFGTLREDGTRRYREIYLEVGKKQGKSTFTAGLALFMLLVDDEPSAEIYGAASSREQAGIVFKEAAAMVRRSPILNSKLRIIESRKIILRRDNPSSWYKAIAADGGTQDGIQPSCVIIDEMHRFSNKGTLDLYEVLTRGTITRRQPLVIQITTAGVPDESPLCWNKHNYARNVQNGVIQDDQFYGKIYGCEPQEVEGEGWLNEELWWKANPSMGEAFPIEAMRHLANQAKNDPTRLPEFLRYNLSVWGRHEQRALDIADWDRNTLPIDMEGLRGKRCYAGLDLSFKYDLTCFVLLFPDDNNEHFTVVPYFWLPKDGLRRAGQKDKVPYLQWSQNGFLETTPGNVIDMSYIERKMLWAAENFDLQEIGFDPWSATELSIRMINEHGLNMVPIRQGFQSLSEPTKKVIELVKTQCLNHGGHPLLRWNADCLALRDDGNGNIAPVKPDRQKSDKRIDGMVALIMATDRAIRNAPEERSVYEDRGVIFV
jgi:phage terminase large subunit-like protein